MRLLSGAGRAAARVLDRLAGERGRPGRLVLDGPEPIRRALEQWAPGHAAALHFIDPGKPIQNGHRASFRGRVRGERLDEHGVRGLVDARRIVEAWRQDCNHARPHSALGHRTPAGFAHQAVTAAAAPTDDGRS